MLSHRYIRSQFRALIHELPAIGSFTEARNFQLIMLIWIKPVIIPVHAQIKHTLITRIKYPRTSDEREKERDSLKHTLARHRQRHLSWQ
jgi:hypothetical protein